MAEVVPAGLRTILEGREQLIGTTAGGGWPLHCPVRGFSLRRVGKAGLDGGSHTETESRRLQNCRREMLRHCVRESLRENNDSSS